MITPTLPTCPKCKLIDQVQKVSSLYGLNTKIWYETSTMTQDGHDYHSEDKHESHTELGLKLKPPEKPGSPVNPGIWYGIGVGLVLLILLGLLPVLITPVLILAGVLADSQVKIPEIAGQPGWRVLAVVGIILLVLVLVALVVGGILVKRRYNRSLAGYKQKKNQYDQEDLPRWESSMKRWDQLYFCLRDETVFLPGEDKMIRLEDMNKYLVDPYFRSL